MRSLFTFAALAGLGAGVCHFSSFLKAKRIDRLQARKLEVWEGEGGSVPVARTRTAAQVRPRKPSSASPRGVS
jgi:hypothetical protein